MGGVGSGRGDNSTTRLQIVTAARVSKELFDCWSEIVKLVNDNYRKSDDAVITCRSKSAMFYLQNALRLASDARAMVKDEIAANRMGVVPTLIKNQERAARQTASAPPVRKLKKAPAKKRPT